MRFCFAGYGADGVVMGVARSSDRVLCLKVVSYSRVGS